MNVGVGGIIPPRVEIDTSGRPGLCPWTPLGPEAPDPDSLRIDGKNGEAQKSKLFMGFAAKLGKAAQR
jgi:hypothetical protein